MMTFNWVIHFNHAIEIFQGKITRLDKLFKEKLNLAILIKNFIQQRRHELKFFAKMREFQFLSVKLPLQPKPLLQLPPDPP